MNTRVEEYSVQSLLEEELQKATWVHANVTRFLGTEKCWYAYDESEMDCVQSLRSYCFAFVGC